jgi:hypothetical protein
MKFKRDALIDDLLISTERSTEKVLKLRQLASDELNYKESPQKWSILECIEHLNLYGDFYLPELERRMLNAQPNTGASVFSSGWIGNYFANLMRVKNGKITKMQTPRDKNPINSSLTTMTLDRFLKQQERLKTLLEQARRLDLTRTRVSISLTPLIKLRLGDTFRFFVYHIERHVAQAENVLKAFQENQPVKL